jgi:CrcB protein
MLQPILLVGAGGFIGSVLRYLISYYFSIHSSSVFPFGTLIVNLLGSFVIGIIIGAFTTGHLSQNMRLLLATGVCGGFTTFSSFSYEFFSLLEHGHTGYAFTYAMVSLAGGLLFVWAGFLLGK